MIENKSRFITFFENLSMVLLCIVMFDASVLGSGNVIDLGIVNFRQIALLLLGISCVPLLIVDFKRIIKNKFIWAVIAFAIWFLISTAIGVKNQNTLISIDFNGFLYLIFMPLALVVLNSRKKVELLMKVMVYGSFILALITTVHLILYVSNVSLFDQIANFEIQIKFARISHISKNIPRIYMLSALYMIAGCAFSMYFLASEKVAWKKCGYIATMALCLFALLLSYTRSVYAGVLVAALVVLVYLFFSASKKERIKFVSSTCACVILFIGIGAAFSLSTGANYIGYALSRSMVSMAEETPPVDNDQTIEQPEDPVEPENPLEPEDPQTPENNENDELNYYNEITLKSDQLRSITIGESIEHIKKSPIIGHGLGFTVPSRPDGNEYSYLDMWLKMGIIGLILYFLPIVFILVNIFKTSNDSLFPRRTKVVWLAVLLGIMVYSIFNPYINSALGIFIYSCTMVVSQNITHKKTDSLEA